ncbi:DUF1360 domain-containing protein [Mesobacillus maritimus]|uniref:DUF1360 domain-containing protein n=1 Tax=Mesobacillus maritimus TaxID=1643336 RepID=UPI00384CE395
MFGGFSLAAILIISLASFRLTRLIVFDKITEFIRSPFFDEVMEEGEVFLVVKPKGIRKWIGEMLSCYWCTGIWVSAILVAGHTFFSAFFTPITLILAIAAIASMIETVISKWLGE